MSRICSQCGRGPQKTSSRSHSNIATKRWRFINIQSKKIDGKREKVCTTCIKTINKKNKKG